MAKIMIIAYYLIFIGALVVNVMSVGIFIIMYNINMCILTIVKIISVSV